MMRGQRLQRPQDVARAEVLNLSGNAVCRYFRPLDNDCNGPAGVCEQDRERACLGSSGDCYRPEMRG